MDDRTREGLREAGRWDDVPGGPDWDGWAAFGAVALLWAVLGVVAPGLLAVLASWLGWGG